MKYLFTLTALLALFAWNTTQAQSTLLSENFETTTVDSVVDLTDWMNVANQGSRKWVGKEYNQNKYAQMSSYNSGEANETWLITPEVTLDGNEEFSFEVNIGYYTHDALTVYISTDFDGSDISGATWNDITNNFTIPQTPTDGYGTLDTAGKMSLSSYSGNTAHIAFVYNGDANAGETTTIQVDSVVVTSTTGIEDEESNQENDIYPNPATSNVNIKSHSNMESITVYNVYGQKVMKVNNVYSDKKSLNVDNLSDGLYMLDIRNADDSRMTKQFMKK